MRQPISALVHPVRRKDDAWEFLLLRRVPRPDLALEAFWQGVTGGVEEGETVEQAARRELREETGIVAPIVEPVGYTYSYPIWDEWRHVYPPGADAIVEHVFVANVAGGLEPTLSDEHDACQWCELEEALGRLTFPGNEKALRRCAAFLDSRTEQDSRRTSS